MTGCDYAELGAKGLAACLHESAISGWTWDEFCRQLKGKPGFGNLSGQVYRDWLETNRIRALFALLKVKP